MSWIMQMIKVQLEEGGKLYDEIVGKDERTDI